MQITRRGETKRGKKLNKRDEKREMEFQLLNERRKFKVFVVFIHESTKEAALLML